MPFFPIICRSLVEWVTYIGTNPFKNEVKCYYYSKFMVENNVVLKKSVVNPDLHND